MLTASTSGSSRSDGQIAFQAEDAIVVVRPDGSGRRAVAKSGEPGGDGYVSAPSWMPGGKKLTYVVGGRANDQVAVVRNADGSGRRELWIDVLYVFSALSWSPDGKAAAYEYVFDVPPGEKAIAGLVYTARKGAKPRSLTHTPNFPHHIWDSAPDWSPDGRTIVFARDPTGNGSTATVLFSVPARGGSPTRLAPGREPDWSPDSHRIAFVRGGAVYTMRADGTHVTRMTRPVNATSPSFSPDGRFIAYASRKGVWIVNTNGGTPRRIATGVVQGVTDSIDWE